MFRCIGMFLFAVTVGFVCDAQECFVYGPNQRLCSPISPTSRACAGSRCLPTSSCGLGRRTFQVPGDDYWMRAADGTLVPSQVRSTVEPPAGDSGFPVVNTHDASCSFSGVCHCIQEDDGPYMRCYMDFDSAGESTSEYLELDESDPCEEDEDDDGCGDDGCNDI